MCMVLNISSETQRGREMEGEGGREEEGEGGRGREGEGGRGRVGEGEDTKPLHSRHLLPVV